jgi:hypothetical protein
MRLRTKIIGVLLCFLLVCGYQGVALSYYVAGSASVVDEDHRLGELNPKAELGMEMGKPFTVPMTWLFKTTHPFTGTDSLVGWFFLWIILILGWLVLSLAYGAAVFGTGCFLSWLLRPLVVRERDVSGDWD